MVVSRQFNYNISVRGYSIFNSKKVSKIKACGVSQTPNNKVVKGGKLKISNTSTVYLLKMKEVKMVT